jgi:hypothetical protein
MGLKPIAMAKATKNLIVRFESQMPLRLLAFLFYLVGDINLMRQVLLLTTLLLFTCFAFGQKKPPQPPAVENTEDKQIERNFQCMHTDRYTATERRSFFPFSAAGKVKLISFGANRLPDPEYDSDGNLIEYVPEKGGPLFTPVAPGKYVINYHKVKEQKTLDNAAVDRLTDILYNVGFTPVKNLGSYIPAQGGCFNPRNAILFLDAKGNVTQYIEICFQCTGYYYSSSKTKPIEYCKQKYVMLSKFFESQGIKFGTI